MTEPIVEMTLPDPPMSVDEYVRHLLAGDDDVCLTYARTLARNLEGLQRLYCDLIEPSQIMVGELWEAGEISVAKEHLATAINRYVATVCYATVAPSTEGRPRAIVACTSDELHELGARLLADLLECDGWDIDFYGTSMPLRDLVQEIREQQPRFVGLSTALTMHLGAVKETIAAIRADLGDSTPPLMVGGAAYRVDPDLWRRVDADLYAPNARAAVALVSQMKDDEPDPV